MPTVEEKKNAPAPRGVKEEARYDKVLLEPGEYEVTRDSTFDIVMPLKKNEAGWWVMVSEKESETIETVTLRMWTYDEMVELRKLATKYDPIRRVHMIDHDVLNRLKIQRYMLRWTFDGKNMRLELQHNSGVLTDEAWAKVKRLQTNLLKHIMEQMNERYEFGG